MDSQQRLEGQQLYSAAVGARSDFYVSRFIGFDTYDSSRVSWNWPAFFATFLWMLYRRMYGYAVVYFLLVPLLAGTLVTVLNIALPPELAPWFSLILLVFVFFVATPMYANAMYHTTIAKKISAAQENAATLDEQVQLLQRRPGTNNIAPIFGAIVAVASAALNWHFRGLLEDTEEAKMQIGNAIMRTGYIQSDLERFYRDHDGRWPRSGEEMALDTSARGRFVDLLEVIEDGSIRLTFGSEATLGLRGKQLLLRPTRGEPQRVDWICEERADSNAVPKKFWPPTCDSRNMSAPSISGFR
jgi:hypothetical protein